MSASLRERTLTGLSWNIGGQLIKQALAFAISVILARLLSPREFGLLGMIVVFTGFAQLFSDLGFGSALIQREEVTSEQLSSTFWLNVAAGVSLTLLLAVAAPWIAGFYDEPRLIPMTWLVSLNFTFGSLGIVQLALLSRALSFRTLASIELLATLVAGIAAVFLALMGYGVYALVWQTLIATLLTVLATWKVTSWRPSFSFHWGAIRQLTGYSSNLLGFSLFNYWVRNADNLLIGRFVGGEGLGVYTRAYSTMLLPISQVSSVIGRVLFPALSRIQSDEARVKGVYLRTIRVISLLTFPMMLGLLVVAEPFVLTLYGARWSAVIPLLQVLCLVGLTQSIGTTTGWIYQSQGRTDWMFRWGVGSGLLTFVAFGIGIRWGVMGVAVAYLLRTLLLTYFNFSIPGRLIGMTFGDVARAVGGSLGAAAAMSAIVWATRFLIPPSWQPAPVLVCQALVGVLVYAALLHLLRLEGYLELRELLRAQWQGVRRAPQQDAAGPVSRQER